MDIITIGLRATIFIPQYIGYSIANEVKMKEIFSNAQVFPVGNMISIGPVNSNVQTLNIPEGAPWQLSTQDLSIQFLGNKIDIVQNKISVRDDEYENNFKNYAVQIFEKILNLFDINYVRRLAYAPTYTIEDSVEFSTNDFWNKTVIHSVFDGQTVQEMVIHSNYKIKYDICGDKYDMNFLSRISEGFKNMAGSSSIKCVIFELDLNTVGEESKFEINHIKSFFDTIGLKKNEYLHFLLEP
jgi:hypothetical protein